MSYRKSSIPTRPDRPYSSNLCKPVMIASIVILGSTSWLAIAEERAPEIEILRPGVKLSVIAEHPDIATPTGVDVDEDGRIWAVACHTHMPPKDYAGPSLDEVLVFEPDGTRRIFYDQTNQTMDLELGQDGWVYLSERDRILRVRDSDGDGVGDVEETIVELISKAVYPHNALSALAWDPNGELVFGLGENFAKAWDLKARDGSSISGMDRGGVFRITADGGKLRKVAEGLWNPFGITVRTDGEIFAAENDPGEYPPCKVLHIVQDGDYGYRRKYSGATPHPFVCWNGELRGTLPMAHPSGEAPCGVVPLGRGLLMPSWGDHRIDFFALEPKGASFSADQVTLLRGSRYFRPACIVHDRHHAKDGFAVFYLTDWVDGRYPVHGYGRLWKLEVDLDEAAWVGPLDLEPRSKAASLAGKLRNGDGEYSRKKLFELSRNEDPFIASAALSSLRRLASKWNPTEFASWPDSDRTQAVQALRLANSEPRPWIQMLLDDEHAAVQFEALRWIADEDHTEFLPAVDELLASADIDFEVFEAGIAAHTSLSGTPELGMRNPDLLLARLQAETSSPAIRAFALRLLPVRSMAPVKDRSTPKANLPKGLTAELLHQLLAVGDPTLSLEVVRVFNVDPAAWADSLVAIAGNESAKTQVRAESILGLAAVASDHFPLLFNLAEHADSTLREEALRALRGQELSDDQLTRLQTVARKFPASAALVTALNEPNSLTVDRPAPSDTESWLDRIAAITIPPDPAAGERIFHHPRIALCGNCHRSEGRGTVVGPNLTHVGGRNDREWLIGAILDPNRDIAPQFMPRVITLNDDSVHVGIRLRSYVNEQIRDALGRNHTFKRDDVKSIEDLSVSFMPPGLPLQMTDRELRDLLAYLETRK